MGDCHMWISHGLSTNLGTYSIPVSSTIIQVLYYSQLLWQVIDPHRDSNYNGAVEALHMLCGSLAAFSAGFLSTQQVERFSFLILTLGSLILGGCLLAAAWSHSVWVAYSAHVLIGALYNFMITVAR